MLRRRALSLKGGFTLIELLVVLAIIGILAGILLPVLMAARQRSRYNTAKAAMRAIAMAIEKYREDFGRYPPDDTSLGAPAAANSSACSTKNGSINLAYYLCQRFLAPGGENHYGPYLEVPSNRLIKVNATDHAIISTLGGYYDYRVQLDASTPKPLIKGYVVVDPGLDLKAGVDWDGSIDSVSGISRGYTSITNAADEKDNIYSNDKQ